MPSRPELARAILTAGALAAAVASAFAPPEVRDALAVGALAAIVLAGVGRPRAPVVAGAPPLDRLDLIFVVAALLLTVAIWTRPGVPGLRHDWFVSPLGAEYGRDAWDVLSPWQRLDLGRPTPQAGLYPFYLALAMLAPLVGTRFALALALAASLALAGWAVRRVALAAGSTSAAAVAAGVVYACSPFFYTRLVAGHVSHFWGAAIVACAPLLAARATRRPLRDGAVAAMVLASAAIQPQYAVIAVVLFVACALRLGRVRLALLAPLGALALAFPTLIAAALAAGDTYVLKRATVAWEESQSSPPAMLLHQGGYLARYFEQTSAVAQGAAFVVGLAALAGAARRRSALGGIVLGAAVLAALLASGVRGPLAPLVAAAFRDVPVASLFRELFDLLPPFALAVAVAAPRALSLRWWPPAVAVAALVGASPAFDGTAQRLIPHQELGAALLSVRSAPGAGCIAWLPGAYPMRFADGRGEGYDDATRPLGARGALYANQPIPAFAAVYTAPTAAEAATRLTALGCDAVAENRSVREAGIPAPDAGLRALAATSPTVFDDGTIRLAALAPARRAAVVGVRFASGSPLPQPGVALLSLDDPANAGPAAALLGMPIDWDPIQPSPENVDPRVAPILGANEWRTYPAYAHVAAENAVVVSDRSLLAARDGILVGASAGKPFDMPVRRADRVALPGGVALVGIRSGPAIVDRTIVPAASGAPASVDVSLGTARICAAVAGGALVLRERYDPGWALFDASGQRVGTHFRADAWANGWIVPVAAGSCFTARFGPAGTLRVAEAIDLVLWIAAFSTLLPFLRRPTV